jgi:glycosyltransferase involved in cell wall biosynthesis
VVIAGEGPEREKLKSLASELGVADRVNFVSAIPHERMPEYLRGSAVYISTARSDGASVSLLEAMACGAFPVVADIAANREWIEDGRNGFLFSAESAKELAEKILESLDREDLRDSACEMNAQIIEQRAQWTSNIEKLLELFGQVMSRR